MGIISDYLSGDTKKKMAIKYKILRDFIQNRDRNISPVNEVDENGMNIIHHAAMRGDIEMIEMLRTSLPSIINNLSKHGKTAYDYAVENSKEDIAVYLQLCGANIKHKTQDALEESCTCTQTDLDQTQVSEASILGDS